MRFVNRKSIVASIAALSIGLGIAASTTDADAAFRMGGGHGGGFHGGGFHGGGGWHGGGWHGGYGGGYGGYYGYGPGWGWGGAALVGGLAAGALIGGAYYGGCYRPTYDQWGNYIGRQYVCY